MESDDERISYLVVGKKGSGKTYYVVAKMLNALITGDVVVSNIRLKWPAVELYCKRMGVVVHPSNYRYLETQAIIDDPKIILAALTGNTFLALDEFHLIFDARAFAETAKKAGGFQVFLSQARKVRVTTYFISQEASLMDTRLAKQASQILDCSNWRHMPVLGPIIPVPITLVRCKDHKGKLLYREWWWRPSAVGKCYDTHQRFLGMELGGAPPRPVIGKRNKRLSYAFRLVAAGLFFVAASRFSNRNKPASPALVALPSPPAPPNPISQRVSYAELVAFEDGLPRLHAVHRHAIVLKTGLRLERGSPLGIGAIVKWGTLGAGVLNVLTDSPEMPIIRLYESIPLRYLPTGDSLRSGAGGPLADGPVSSQSVPQLAAGRVDAVAPPPVFNPPQPFIPQMSPVRALWFTSERIGSATPVHGFSDSPYK